MLCHITLLDMSMGLIILASVMLITNILTVYFTFTTWYSRNDGDSSKREIPVYYNEQGKLTIDDDEINKDANV